MNSSAITQPILQALDISKTFGGVQAVSGTSIDVKRGSVTALIGPNGAGKTTLFNILTGMVVPDTGSVLVEGQQLQGKSPHRIARAGVGRTFQGAHVVTRMSVWDNVMLGAVGNPGDKLLGFFQPRARNHFVTGAESRATELLEEVGLMKLKDEFAGNLSGGQRKLLDFARAMMSQPRILLLDEPFAGVNPTLRLGLTRLIKKLQSDESVTFLLVEHDLPAVMKMSHHVYVMAEGSVIYSGPPDGVLQDQQVADAYLGPRSGSAR